MLVCTKYTAHGSPGHQGIQSKHTHPSTGMHPPLGPPCPNPTGVARPSTSAKLNNATSHWWHTGGEAGPSPSAKLSSAPHVVCTGMAAVSGDTGLVYCCRCSCRCCCCSKPARLPGAPYVGPHCPWAKWSLAILATLCKVACYCTVPCNLRASDGGRDTSQKRPQHNSTHSRDAGVYGTEPSLLPPILAKPAASKT